MCNQRALKARLSADCGFFFVFFTEARNIYFSQCSSSTHLEVQSFLPCCCRSSAFTPRLTWVWHWHTLRRLWCFLFFFLWWEQQKSHLRLNYNWACHCERMCVCVCLYLRVCVYPTWAECRHQAQTSSICPNSTAVYKAQTSNITTKLHSLIKTLFTVAMIIYPVTCALHKSKHRGMPMCVCVGWQKYTAAAGPHVWRPALHTP